jgi:transposase
MVSKMGKLLVMPAEQQTAETNNQPEAGSQIEKEIDFNLWKSAPRERTPHYFPVYSNISRAMQAAMRRWTREWFHAHPEILIRRKVAYSYLVYITTHPYYGKPANCFTYDILDAPLLRQAYASAARRLKGEMELLDTKTFPWFTREYYFAYRSKIVIDKVAKYQQTIFRMFRAETLLMDAILKFTQIDIPSMKFEAAVAELRRAFHTNLRRFSKEFDLSPRTDELLKIATDALVSKAAYEQAMPLAA